MKTRQLTLIITILWFGSCRPIIERETTNFEYFNVPNSDTAAKSILLAVTDEEFLQYGSRVAYVNNSGDTIIPFGKYAYYGAESLVHFANVLEFPNDSKHGRQVAINREQKIFVDLVMFDNGPEPFNDSNFKRKLNSELIEYGFRLFCIIR